MKTSLQARTQQATKMSPSMRLGLSLLALPINELKAEVKKELESNPALEGSFPLIPQSMSGLTGANGFVLENAKARGVTLIEHLLSELRMSGMSEREEKLTAIIVYNLNESGYFVGSYPDIIMELSVNGIDTDEEELEKARLRVMKIDPKGCGARNLEECLLSQINVVPKVERERVAKLIPVMCNNKASPEEVAYLRPFIMKMRPAPGKLFEYVKIDYITPDIEVDSDGAVSVDTKELPELSISNKYVEMAKDHELDEETREYAIKQVKRAREFTAALERRNETMRRIAEVSIASQEEFIKSGKAAIKALTMSEVAKAVGCVVSTVSRAANRKFVKTPHGTIPLRTFFALKDQAPYEKLRQILKSLPKDVKVSDREVAELMGKAGFPMARRTIAKWRSRLR